MYLSVYISIFLCNSLPTYLPTYVHHHLTVIHRSTSYSCSVAISAFSCSIPLHLPLPASLCCRYHLSPAFCDMCPALLKRTDVSDILYLSFVVSILIMVPAEPSVNFYIYHCTAWQSSTSLHHHDAKRHIQRRCSTVTAYRPSRHTACCVASLCSLPSVSWSRTKHNITFPAERSTENLPT